MKYSLKNSEISVFNESDPAIFPKYTSQLINLANQNAQGTRPSSVGQMSELFPEFMRLCGDITIANWRRWYTDRFPETLEKASEKIYNQVQNLKDAIDLIDIDMVRQWVEDLLISKTFNGLYIQRAVLASLADKKRTDYRLASPEEEASGIDGYVGGIPYSVKPDTYKTMDRLSEEIDVKMIYYKKTKSGLAIETED